MFEQEASIEQRHALVQAKAEYELATIQFCASWHYDEAAQSHRTTPMISQRTQALWLAWGRALVAWLVAREGMPS